MTALKDRHCQALGNMPPCLDETQVLDFLHDLHGWKTTNDGWAIRRGFQFADYDETADFVAKVVAIAKQQDHHPDIEFSYKNCSVLYSTHTAGGLTEKDMICAARINALLADG